MPRKVYFAHPISYYGSDAETAILNIYSRELEHDGGVIINPGSTDIQNQFKVWKQKNPDENPMQFFTNLVAECDGFIFMTFPPDLVVESIPNNSAKPWIGAGVWAEMQAFHTLHPSVPLVHVSTTQGGGVYENRYHYAHDGHVNCGVFLQLVSQTFTVLDIEQTRAALKAHDPSYVSFSS